MYARILVPLDGSPVAAQVLPYVRLLGKGFHAEVELLQIFEPISASLADPAHGLYLDQIIASERSHVEDYLEGVAESLRKDGLTVSCVAHEGYPAASIVQEAEMVPATLVAMCSHGRSGITGWLLGSTADKVLHATSQPVLIVRSRDRHAAGPEAKLSSLLVPLDGSPLAEQALPHAVALAEALGLKVILVRVTPSMPDYTLHFASRVSYPFAHIHNLSKEVDGEARAYLDAMCKKLRQHGFPSVERRLVHGDPAGALIDMAREFRDSLIVMTTHGASGMYRWIRGSVTDRVVRHAEDPVLIIRAMKHAAEEA
jgi:nucleotide-binding universal stress UspA family protein